MRKLFGNKAGAISQELNSRFFIIGVTIIVVASFLTLVPKVSSTLFPQKRIMVWNEFLGNTQKKGLIDPQEYWRFREFYSPGYFEFSKNGLPLTQDSLDSNETDLVRQLYPDNLVFLKFNSSYLSSFDVLTEENELDKIVSIDLRDAKILFQAKNQIIFEENNTVKIMFLKSIDEMKKANGYFDYGERDIELIRGKYWLNITIFNLL